MEEKRDAERLGSEATVSRRYVATLAAIAVVLLAVGLLARRWLETPRAASAAPPSQASALQQLSMSGQLRRTATFVAERAAESGAFITFVPATGATGIRWRNDTLVTTDRTHVVRALVSASADSGQGVVRIAPDTVRRDWLLVVARDSSGHLLSTSTLAGGRTTTSCGGRMLERYVLGAPLDERLAGAGIFNVDGELLGMAVWCGERVVAIPAREITPLLAPERPPMSIESPLGFTVASGDSVTRRFVGSDSAVLVVGVQRGSVADAAGIRAGDRLVEVNGRSAGSVEARTALAGPAIDSVSVLRRRGNALVRTTLNVARTAAAPPPRDAYGISLTGSAPAPGVPIDRVEAGSLGARAGLRAGDRLLRVNDLPVSSVAVAQRLLGTSARADSAPVILLVIERDGVERGLLLAPGDTTPANGGGRR